MIKLYSDFKHKHGYMIFMTPQNGYRIIWAKMLYAILQMLAMGIVIAGCMALTAAVADSLHDGIIRTFFAALRIGTGTILGMGGLGLLQILAQLSIAVLAVTVSRSMMQSSSYNWLIALLMYFALALVVNLVDGALLLAFGITGDVMQLSSDAVVFGSQLMTKYYLIGAVTYSAWFVGCTTLSGRLVNRGIDL